MIITYRRRFASSSAPEALVIVHCSAITNVIFAFSETAFIYLKTVVCLMGDTGAFVVRLEMELACSSGT